MSTSTATTASPASLAGDVIAQTPRSVLVKALMTCLRSGFDPELDPPRTHTTVPAGQLLTMPSGTHEWVGTKLVTIAPANPSAGLPLVQGTYVLFDGHTLAPRCLLDGAALTALRTAAVSMLALQLLQLAPTRRAVIIGCGVQAAAHLDALLECTAIEHIDVVARRPGSSQDLLSAARTAGRTCREVAVGQVGVVNGADVVVCATSSRTPLFSAELLDERSTVLAIGSYQPTTTELDPALVGRSQVVVESIASALREAGDVLLPLARGLIQDIDLVTLAALATGTMTPDASRPRLFKGTGMAWQDLVCAAAVATWAPPSPQGCDPPPRPTAMTT